MFFTFLHNAKCNTDVSFPTWNLNGVTGEQMELYLSFQDLVQIFLALL